MAPTRRSLVLFTALFLGGCPPPAAPPPAPAAATAAPARTAPVPPVPIGDYFKTRRIGPPSVSFDEQLMVYSSDAGGRPDLWTQPIAGGPATQITHVAGILHGYALSPAADRLLYEADQGGDELPHMYLTNSKGEAPRDLCAAYPPGARSQFIRWADDGKTFLFLANVRDRKDLDLYEYDLAKDKATLLWEGAGNVAFALASRDGRRFILSETLSDVNTNLYLLDRGKKDRVLLTPHKGDVLYTATTLSRDGGTLYYTSDEGGEFTALYSMSLASKKSQKVLAESWDVEEADFSRGWRYFYTVTNVDGTARLVVKDAQGKGEVALPAPPAGGAWAPSGFSRTDRYLSVTLHGDTAPVQGYLLDLKEGKALRLAEALPETLRGRKMETGRSVRIKSFDGREVPALLYLPGAADRARAGAGPLPAFIDVHGGPTAQSRRDFGLMRQYLLTKGYAVLVPNVRGSTGYGKSYTKLDNLDLGGGPLKDIVACKSWLVKEAGVDPARVVVSGGSYGGYMALAAATFTPREFVAHVDYFGVSDLKSLVESFPPYWASSATYIYQKFGNPKDPAHAAYQHDRSPLYFLDRIERPLLVVQGDRDARVKKDQSDRVVEALRRRSVPVHYLVLKDEGHGFSRNESRLAALEATDRFLDRYVLGDKAVEVLPGGGAQQ